MRILVTGLNGFTGRHLQHELEEHGHSVFGLKADLTSLDAIASDIKEIQPDAVIHLAGIAFVGHGDANSFYEVNLIGTRNLLLAIEQHAPNVSAVLLTSSANVYGNQTEGKLAETTLPKPANDYAASKLGMEYMARLWFKRLPIFIVRPFNYTGRGQSQQFLIPKIVAHFRDNAPVIQLGNIDISRDFCDVRSVSFAYRSLIESKPIGKTLNICSGQAYTLRDIVSSCEIITQHTLEVQVNPKFVRKNEVRTLIGDPSLLKSNLTNWLPIPFAKTLEWMLHETG